MRATVNAHCTRPDGSRDSFASVECEMKERKTPWSAAELRAITTGNRGRAKTRYIVLLNSRWHRVFFEAGREQLFIGKSIADGFIVHPTE